MRVAAEEARLDDELGTNPPWNGKQRRSTRILIAEGVTPREDRERTEGRPREDRERTEREPREDRRRSQRGPKEDPREFREWSEKGPREDLREFREKSERGPREDLREFRERSERGPRRVRKNSERGPKEDPREFRVGSEWGPRRVGKNSKGDPKEDREEDREKDREKAEKGRRKRSIDVGGGYSEPITSTRRYLVRYEVIDLDLFEREQSPERKRDKRGVYETLARAGFTIEARLHGGFITGRELPRNRRGIIEELERNSRSGIGGDSTRRTSG